MDDVKRLREENIQLRAKLRQTRPTLPKSFRITVDEAKGTIRFALGLAGTYDLYDESQASTVRELIERLYDSAKRVK